MKKGIIGFGGFGREVKQIILDNNPNEIVDFFVLLQRAVFVVCSLFISAID